MDLRLEFVGVSLVRLFGGVLFVHFNMIKHILSKISM